MKVTRHTKSTRGREYRCSGCKQESSVIAPGEEYYEWHPRNGPPGRRHVKCGYPRRSMLSGSKLGTLWDAQDDANEQIDAWAPEIDSPDYSDVKSALESVAEAARDVGQEYADGIQNMPDALQYSPTAEAMQQCADDCEAYADALDGWSPDEEEPDLPEGLPDDDGFDENESDRTKAFEEWVEAVKDSARAALEDDSPEYQG